MSPRAWLSTHRVFLACGGGRVAHTQEGSLSHCGVTPPVPMEVNRLPLRLGVGGLMKRPHTNPSTLWDTAGWWLRLSLLHTRVPPPCPVIRCALGLTPTLTAQTSATPQQAVGSDKHTPTDQQSPKGSRMSVGGVRYPPPGQQHECWGCHTQTPVPRGLQDMRSLTHAHVRVQDIL